MKSILIVFASFFSCAFALSCTRCEEVNCGPKPACKAGYTKDVCGCCDICAKREGQLCNGLWNFHGDCATGLACMHRKKSSMMAPGRCEPAACSAVSCGIHQRCTLIDGKPTCECPRHCKNKDKPVCGLTNGVDYANECELRKFECKNGVKIEALQGPCKRCFHDGELYKFKEKILNKDICGDCVCIHGNWNCTLNNECMRKRIEMLHKPRSKATTAPLTTEQLGCPMFKCRPCKYGYVIDQQGCQTCDCKEKKTVCEQPMYPGPCKAFFPRFYYNRKYNKCVQFTYGGCHHNGNNFKTKKVCEAKCLNHGSV